MHLRRLSLAALVGAASLLVVSASGVEAVTPAETPQRIVSQQWVGAIGRGDQRSACELQTIQEVTGRSCAALPSEASPPKCPKAGPGAKPNYRKSEVRTAAEQVGEFTVDSPTRGFVKVYAQVKAKKLWGALGLEQDASGSWRVTYLRYAGETFVPAGTSYQSEAWHKLWLGSQCPTNHPQWEKKR
jgi:hypothetical protein